MYSAGVLDSVGGYCFVDMGFYDCFSYVLFVGGREELACMGGGEEYFRKGKVVSLSRSMVLRFIHRCHRNDPH